MNPSLVRELDAEAAAIVRAINDIPRGREHDMTGHLDAKRAVMRQVERLAKRWRETVGGVTAKAPVPAVFGPAKTGPQRARRAEDGGAR